MVARLQVLALGLLCALLGALLAGKPAMGGAFAPPKGVGTDYCLVNDTTQQGSGSDAVITYAGEVADPADMHSTSSNTSRITVVTTGTYLIWANTSSRTNGSAAQFTLKKNGTAITGATWTNLDDTACYQVVPYAYYADLTAGDYVEISCNTASNSINNSTVTGRQSYFGVERLPR